MSGCCCSDDSSCCGGSESRTTKTDLTAGDIWGAFKVRFGLGRMDYNFARADGKAQIADLNACMECGACASNCPTSAIEVNAGVGCAAAIVASWFTGKEPSCDCSGGECC